MKVVTEALSEPAVALLFADADLGAHLRESLQTLGARIVHEGTPAAVTREDLVESGAEVVVVNLDDSDDDQIDHLYDVIDEDRQRVVFNDASVSRTLSGWDRARWARHLAAKLLGRGDVDPPRPSSARAIEPMMAAMPAADPHADSEAQAATQAEVLTASTVAVPQSEHAESASGATLESPTTDTSSDLEVEQGANPDEILQFEALQDAPGATDSLADEDATVGHASSYEDEADSLDTIDHDDASSTDPDVPGLDAIADADESTQSTFSDDDFETGSDAETVAWAESDATTDWTSQHQETSQLQSSPVSAQEANWDVPISLDLDELIRSVRSSGHENMEPQVPGDDVDHSANDIQHVSEDLDLEAFDAAGNPESFDIDSPVQLDEVETLEPANSFVQPVDEPLSAQLEDMQADDQANGADFSWKDAGNVDAVDTRIVRDHSAEFTSDAAEDPDAVQVQAQPQSSALEHSPEAPSIIERQTVSSLPPVEDWDLVDFDALAPAVFATPGEERMDATAFGIHKVQPEDYLAPHAEEGESPVSPGMTLELVPPEQAIAPHVNADEPRREMHLHAASGAIRTLVVLAATAAGASATNAFVAALKSPVRALLLYVQHHRDGETEALVARLAADSALSVRIIEDGMQAQTNQVLVLPAGKRCQIGRDGRVHVQSVTSKDVNDPSIDDCLTSASSTFGADLVALIFAGDANDALAGAQAVHDRRGRVWVQDPQTCSANGMATMAIEDGLAEFVGSPAALAARMGEVFA